MTFTFRTGRFGQCLRQSPGGVFREVWASVYCSRGGGCHLGVLRKRPSATSDTDIWEYVLSVAGRQTQVHF